VLGGRGALRRARLVGPGQPINVAVLWRPLLVLKAAATA
jgi:hypothetical protein